MMDFRFIYVFSKDERDILLDNNYQLIQENENDNIYIFLNDTSRAATFELNDCMFSNVISL